ncbi:MAG: hypothetical protein JJU02_05505 [Cryomorphaceae bacterium]|nr:hypothetical protein [Cryomorphaceae bacterium]
MRIQKSTDKEDFDRKRTFGADSKIDMQNLTLAWLLFGLSVFGGKLYAQSEYDSMIKRKNKTVYMRQSSAHSNDSGFIFPHFPDSKHRPLAY